MFEIAINSDAVVLFARRLLAAVSLQLVGVVDGIAPRVVYGKALCRSPILRVSPSYAAAAAAECRQSLAELLSEETVDDEVRRRVGRHEDVADVVVVEVDPAAVVPFVAHDVVEKLVDECRRLADEEYQYDDDHDEREVLRLARLAGHRRRQPALGEPAPRQPQLADEAGVEDDEDDQRSGEDEEAVEDVLVNDVILGRFLQLRRTADEHDGAVVVNALCLDAKLEESRHVVEQRHRAEGDHLHPRLLHRAQARRLERPADGDVAVEGDHDGDPDGPELGDVNERPDDDGDVGDQRVGEVAHVERQRRRDLREAGCEQEQVVHAGHHLRNRRNRCRSEATSEMKNEMKIIFSFHFSSNFQSINILKV